MNERIILFESGDAEVSLDVHFDGDTVWLTKEQMGVLFDRDRTVISRHIANVYREGEVEREGTCANFAQVRFEGSREVTRREERFNLDGNKRIAATMFLYFLDRNEALFRDGAKLIADETLVAITIMIAESRPDEKDAMIALVMNCLALGRQG